MTPNLSITQWLALDALLSRGELLAESGRLSPDDEAVQRELNARVRAEFRLEVRGAAANLNTPTDVFESAQREVSRVFASHGPSYRDGQSPGEKR